MKTIDDLEVAGRRVLVRADLNVPLDGARITDDARIRASLPTLSALLDRGAGIVLCAHLGRPGGQPDPRFSLAPVAVRLSELLGRPVALAADSVGPAARQAVAALRPGGVVLLENLRFSAAETSKDDGERAAFADRLAELADLYVGDGFGVLHRKHASVYDVPLRLPHAAGYLVVAETGALSRLADDIQRPYVVVLGGAKVADKIEMVGALLARADVLLIGGAMAVPFLAAQGYPVGSSVLDDSTVAVARGLLEQARHDGAEIVLPSDFVAAAARAADSPARVVPAAAIPSGLMALDIGPESARQFASRLAVARTVFWNGPMGVFELAPFAEGTRVVAQGLIDSGAFSVVGGGDTTAAVRALGFAAGSFGYLSTGGGASLEYLEGRELPGLMALQEAAPALASRPPA
jgi:phosphoglycerate kinase